MPQDKEVTVACLWASDGTELFSFLCDRAWSGLEHEGAQPEVIDLHQLRLPGYASARLSDEPPTEVDEWLATLRRADGFIVAMTTERGEIAAGVRNAFDHAEGLHADQGYLDGRGVGFIVLSPSLGRAEAALVALRSMVHSLQGWPMPMSSALATADAASEAARSAFESACRSQVDLVVKQVVTYARAWAGARNGRAAGKIVSTTAPRPSPSRTAWS